MSTRSKFHLLATALSVTGAVLLSGCGVDAPANDDKPPGMVTQAVTTPLAELYSPGTPGSTVILPGAQVTFSWTFGTLSQEYWLYLGNTFGAADIYSSGPIDPGTTSMVVPNLPTDGRTIYAVLWTLTSSGWQYHGYVLTAATAGSGFAPPQLISPVNGSTLAAGSSFTFSWTPGATTDGLYSLALGSSPGQTDISVGLLPGTAQFVTIPTWTTSVYVQLWSHTSAGWHAPQLYSFPVH